MLFLIKLQSPVLFISRVEPLNNNADSTVACVLVFLVSTPFVVLPDIVIAWFVALTNADSAELYCNICPLASVPELIETSDKSLVPALKLTVTVSLPESKLATVVIPVPPAISTVLPFVTVVLPLSPSKVQLLIVPVP